MKLFQDADRKTEITRHDVLSFYEIPAGSIRRFRAYLHNDSSGYVRKFAMIAHSPHVKLQVPENFAPGETLPVEIMVQIPAEKREGLTVQFEWDGEEVYAPLVLRPPDSRKPIEAERVQ